MFLAPKIKASINANYSFEIKFTKNTQDINKECFKRFFGI